jgi:hypothetical protein
MADIKTLSVTKQELEAILSQSTALDFTGDMCGVYQKARPFLEAAVAILRIFLPPASAALAAIMVLLDKACGIGIAAPVK